MALERKTREENQSTLFEVGESWEENWWGMPSYVMGDARPMYSITVNIFTVEDLKEFGQRISQPVGPKTDSLCFPAQNLDKPSDWIYTDEV